MSVNSTLNDFKPYSRDRLVEYSLIKRNQLPLALLVPSESYDIGSCPQRQIFAKFVSDLEGYFNIQAEHVSIPELWDRDPPADSKGMSLKKYLSEDVCFDDRSST